MGRLEPVIHSGGLLALYPALWAPYYAAVLDVLGPTGTILPLGDPPHGQPNATTFTTKGEEQVTFTWSEAPSAFDTKLDLTDPASFQGIIPLVKFNGTDEDASSPDAAYWTRVGAAFSIGAWVNVASLTANHSLLSKYTLTTGAEQREFRTQITVTNGVLRFRIFDQSLGETYIGRTAPAVVTDRWYFLVFTSGGGATAATIKIYKDGAAADDTDDNNGVFVAQEDTTALVRLGSTLGAAARDMLFNGKMAGGPLGPFFTQKQLTADEVTTLYDLGRAALGL